MKNNIYLNLLLIVVLLLLLNCNIEDKNNSVVDKTKQFFNDHKDKLILLLGVGLLLYLLYNQSTYNNVFYDVNDDSHNNDKISSKVSGKVFDDSYNNDRIKNRVNDNITVVEEVKPNITLYYASWCPHCNSLKPIWNKFYEKNKNNGVYDIKVVDCSENCPNPDVEGYPTILVSDSNGYVSDFSGEIKSDKDLENYVLSKLQ